ncbi:TNF receptor-associated factor 4 isoform X1 [Lemur catta]|uniref:TNF receptor-associated factor 4 isoform X1 n=1 Tax=Lemur catta TaxID=9447 RepID=UPI001E26B1CA|nr:TNF receptor-associated factor 4 isoform X1 [Lemur catta]
MPSLCGGTQSCSVPTRSAPSPSGGKPDLWLRARTPPPGGRKQSIEGQPGTEQADWLPLQRECHVQACWDLASEQLPPAVPFITGHRGANSLRGCYWHLRRASPTRGGGGSWGLQQALTLASSLHRCPQIYPDPELEVQVLGLPIRCIHSEEGCRWSGQLRHLQGHLNTCSFNVVPCPNRCPAKLSRRDLPAHLQHDCPKRRLKCEFCGCDFSGEAYESHEGMCPQESVYCENKCGARMMRRLLAQHATSECPKRTQPCTYCTKEFVFDTIQSHQYQCPRLPVPCPNQCGVGTVAREDLPGHLKDSCSTALVLCPFKDSGCKHRCPKLAMARHVEESVKPHLAMMCALVSRQRQELQELRRELEELSVGSDGVLIWKIGSYGRRLQEAKAKPNLECFSPAFYTHKYGYKLQVSAFLNGNGSGEGTHLSLYIRVLPGAFDNLLEWPFARRVTFSLLDQSDPGLAKPQHVTETFHPDPNWKNFQKPGTWRGSLDESSLGFGYPKFISHQDIRKRNYVRDDAVFIKASVELPRKILT